MSSRGAFFRAFRLSRRELLIRRLRNAKTNRVLDRGTSRRVAGNLPLRFRPEPLTRFYGSAADYLSRPFCETTNLNGRHAAALF
jgi:hypothetical protein